VLDTVGPFPVLGSLNGQETQDRDEAPWTDFPSGALFHEAFEAALFEGSGATAVEETPVLRDRDRAILRRLRALAVDVRFRACTV